MCRETEAKRKCLADPRTREIVDVVAERGQPVHIDRLADRLVRRDEPVLTDDDYAQRLEREQIALHHRDLPKLDRFGIVEYDLQDHTVSMPDAAAGAIDWSDADRIDQVLNRLIPTQQADENAIGVLEGRQAVIEHGRALADEAEEELFCLYVRTDLLEAECLTHAEAAIDRGVDLFVGSREPAVRDLARKHLPEATLWEPQRAWLGSAVGSPRVGRLVLVDRRQVMLAILDEPESEDAVPEETALVGTGEDNPLVVLVRELLGPRLDHLDHQSADFRNELLS